MINIIIKVALIMCVMLVFIVPGYLLKRFKLVEANSLFSISNVLLYYAQPMVILKAFTINPIAPSKTLLINFLYVFIFSFISILLTFFVSKLVFCYIKKPEDKKKKDIYSFVCTFSNCAFVGIPFVDMFTDGNSEAMMYLIIFNVAFNLIIWTLGAYLITQDKKQISLRKAFLNPCSIGAIIGFILFIIPQINVFNFDSVKELRQIVTSSASMTAPLSMLIVGIRIAEIPPKRMLLNKNVYLSSITRLIISPLLTYLLVLPFKLLGTFSLTPYVLLAPVIAMAMPPAASIVAFAEKFKSEQELASESYAMGNLLSILTLPIILSIIMI